jgi:hypothetical protein
MVLFNIGPMVILSQFQSLDSQSTCILHDFQKLNVSNNLATIVAKLMEQSVFYSVKRVNYKLVYIINQRTIASCNLLTKVTEVLTD